MKNFLILLLVLAFIGCSKDDDTAETKCAVSEFVGVWNITGSGACILTDTEILTITDIGNGKIQGVYSGNGTTSSFSPWTVSNCTFTGSVKEAGFIDVTITGTLSGGKLKIENKGTVFGLPLNCTENLTK